MLMMAVVLLSLRQAMSPRHTIKIENCFISSLDDAANIDNVGYKSSAS
jgi:hypothetical protein